MNAGTNGEKQYLEGSLVEKINLTFTITLNSKGSPSLQNYKAFVK